MTYNVTIFRGTVFAAFNSAFDVTNNMDFWASAHLHTDNEKVPEFMIIGAVRAPYNHERIAQILRAIYPPLLPQVKPGDDAKRDWSVKLAPEEFLKLTRELHKLTAATMHFIIDGQVIEMTRLSSVKADKQGTSPVRFRNLKNSDVVSYGVRERFIREKLVEGLNKFSHPKDDLQVRRNLSHFIGNVVHTAGIQQGLGEDGQPKPVLYPNINIYNTGHQCFSHQLSQDMWI